MVKAEADWYLQEWLTHFEKIQSSLVTELGWDKARANFLYHGKQPYKRSDLAAVAKWLNIEPYELLLPPEKALAIRRLYQSAQAIVAGGGGDRFLPPHPGPIVNRRTGTVG